MGGGKKRAKQFFEKLNEKCGQKMLGKKSSQKSAKKRFLYSYEYRDQKMGGKKARNNLCRNTRMMRTKKCCEKNRIEKLRKKRF